METAETPLSRLRLDEASKTGAAILAGSGRVGARHESHYSLEGKCCDKIVPPESLIRVARADPPKSTAARAIAVNPRGFRKHALLAKFRLYSKCNPDGGPVRKSSRPRRSAPAAALGLARCRNVIRFGLVRPRRARVEEGLILPGTAWAGVRSGRFGEQRDGLLPSQSRHAGRRGVIWAPEGV